MVPQTSTIWPFWPKICIFGRIPHFWVYAENFVCRNVFPTFWMNIVALKVKNLKKTFFDKNANLEKSYCPWW